MKLYQLFEAIPPSMYRKYRQMWDPATYEKIFKRYTKQAKAFRIYLPLIGGGKQQSFNDKIKKQVTDNLKTLGYTVSDYAGGYAVKDNSSRTTKIGKLLNGSPLLQSFVNDPARSMGTKQNNQLLVCISRHPYDIASMSTGRGWTSCMNLVDGDQNAYVMVDVTEGTLVAYLINANDTNIEHPIGRVLIKPFIKNDDPADFILVAEQRVYGTNTPGFKETVHDWLSGINKGKDEGLYAINPNHYADSARSVLYAPGKNPKEILDMVIADPRKYNVPKNLTYEMHADGSISMHANIYGALLRILDQYNIKIKKLKGDFDCSMLSLASLPSCTPSYITGNFDCSNNAELTSLDGAPIMVSGTVTATNTALQPKDVRKRIVANNYEL